jgi:UPF0176 protein
VTLATSRILLYYLYTRIDDPAGYVEELQELCESLGLRGRIIVALEGVNGTVSGDTDACDRFMAVVEADQRMKGVEFKIDEAEEHAFPKLSVKERAEVVSLDLGEKDFFPPEDTGEYLEPVAWREMMRREDVVVLDARNDYEWALGRFEGAVLPKVESFRELPDWVRDHRDELEGKKILTYCTGGIRCEKFSGFLKREGFPEVYQLHGGIVKYGKDPAVRGEGFEGKCYVFVERIGVEVNEVDRRVVGACLHCGGTCDRYVNCAWPCCNAQYFCCPDCEESASRYCSPVCGEARVLGLAAFTTEVRTGGRRS